MKYGKWSKSFELDRTLTQEFVFDGTHGTQATYWTSAGDESEVLNRLFWRATIRLVGELASPASCGGSHWWYLGFARRKD